MKERDRAQEELAALSRYQRDWARAVYKQLRNDQGAEEREGVNLKHLRKLKIQESCGRIFLVG